jgi:hypothetical protein
VARARRTSPGLLALGTASVAVFFAVGGDVHPLAAQQPVEPVIDDVPVCCAELVVASPVASSPTYIGAGESMAAAPVDLSAASRWRVIDTRAERVLPAGDAPEQGLQVKTVFTSRAISALFPEIDNIGGVRPDSLRWHPGGLALDVMIPNHGGADGIALGDEIVAFVMKNATRLGIQDAIWRGVYYTPGSARSGGYGHYDHVHITTVGGGYPSGDEEYLR